MSAKLPRRRPPPLNSGTIDKTRLTECERLIGAKKIGRPTLYSPEVVDGLLNWLADGKSLRKYCEQPGTPNKVTVLRWLSANPDFSDQYARAREAGADSHLDDIVDIADTDPDPKRARVRIDAWKWVASKLAPRKYGERLDLSVEEKPASRAELEAEARAFLKRLGQNLAAD